MFTCLTCRVGFHESDLQRTHYQTEWHRYNLKRKVASLPPVTQEAFDVKLLDIRSETTSNTDLFCCTICNKRFNTQNAYENHVQSGKHKLAVKASSAQTLPVDCDKAQVESSDVKDPTLSIMHKHKVPSDKFGSETLPEKDTCDFDAEEQIDSSENSSDVDDALGLEECLFCQNIADSLDGNMKHMSLVHSFFIPDVDYLIDLQGFVNYLGEKVGRGKMCLFCNEKSRNFPDLKAVQRHMVDKSHCQLKTDADSMLEYSDYYDYSSSYPEDSTNTSGNDSEVVTGEALVENEYMQLVLPSGGTVGHRSLIRYYRQYLKPTRAVALVGRSKANVGGIIAHYKSLGWTGTSGEMAKRKAKDQAFVQRMRSQYHLSLGVKANKLQHHFRSSTGV